MLPVPTANEVVVEFPFTITEAGMVKVEAESAPFEVLLKDTEAPVDGAGEDKVTVHVPPEFELNVAGLHCSEETTIEEPVKLSVTLCEDPL
jgi:hypothetical protein